MTGHRLAYADDCSKMNGGMLVYDPLCREEPSTPPPSSPRFIADERPERPKRHVGPPDSLVPGLTLGLADGDPVIGGEVSTSWHLDKEDNDPPLPLLWGGFYVDGVYDGKVSRGRFTAGPQLGLGPFGLDGGAVVSTTGPVGGAIRALIATGVLDVYARAIWNADPRASDGPLVELGLLLKLPFIRSSTRGWQRFTAYDWL